MKQLITAVALSMAAMLPAAAQRGFTHGPDQGIEARFFDTSLAPFYHGVASGDPLDDRVIIWTRVTPSRDTLVRVGWKMATDTAFTHVVASGFTTTDYTKDYTVKIDVAGLQQGQTYYYYFSALNRNSLIGRTHTMPLTSVNHLRFAVVSCTNYQMGYFNGYKRIAERNDLDAVLHLGDYIYEYPMYGYGYTAEVGRIHRPDNEIITLDDYRIRHSFYKLDPDLRAAHQQHPFITIWDDHEIANNTWEHGAANHDSLTEGDFETRKQSGIRAYLEWLPIRHPDFVNGAKIYRQFQYGKLANLLMMDTRVEDRDKQAASAADPSLTDSNRHLIGDTQRVWLDNHMASSSATWQILGNQIMFSQEGPNPALDAWTGYPAERQKVMRLMQRNTTKNNIVLTGDTHRSWAFDLTERPYDTASYQPLSGKGTFGVEWGTPSLASPNRNEGSPGTSPLPTEQALYNGNPQLRYNNQDDHGYFILDLTKARAQADFYFVDTKVRSTAERYGRSWFTNAGEGYLQEATSPATGKIQQEAPAPARPAGFGAMVPTAVQPPVNMLVSGIYPNPAKDVLYLGVVLNEAQHLQLVLRDMSGRTVLQDSFRLDAGNQKIKLLLPVLPAGNYSIELNDGRGGIQQRKLGIY
jgi:alkaline phosphatase D